MKRCAFVLAACLLLPAAVQAQFLFTINNGAVTITGYTDTATSVVIPESLDGYPVTAIGPAAFMRNNGIDTVSIPDTVTNIGTNAFEGCAYLTGITVDPANPAFSSLNGVLFNQNQTVLIAFPGDDALGSYTIPATVTNIAGGAFQDCGYPSTVVIGSNVVCIGDNAFNSARAATVSLTNGLVSIGNYAFFDVPVSSVSIPATVTNIGAAAFSGTEVLGKISVSPSNAFYVVVGNVLFNTSQTTLLQFPSESSLRSYTIPNSVTNVGAGAFYYSTLTNIAFGANVQFIGDSAFYVCDALTSLNLDANLLSIGPNAFLGLNVSSLTIPPNVTTIGDSAFLACEEIPTITIPASVTNFGAFVFRSCFALTNISVNSQNPAFSSAGGVMFNKPGTVLLNYPEGKTNTFYSIPNGVTNVADGAFALCSVLGKIAVPAGLTGIGQGSFLGCYDLTNLALPPSFSSIGPGTFEDCWDLPSIALGAGVTVIPDYAFYDCRSLTNLNLPNGVTSIGELAFYGTALSSLTIPASVTNLSELAFVYCFDLSSVYFAGEPPAADPSAFGTESPTAYYLPGTPGWGTNFDGLATALWTLPSPAILSGSASAAGGQFGFTISWATNVPVVVDVCTNLAAPAWQPLETNNLNNGVCSFTDPAAAALPCRFYRVRSE